jgi:hypothetical protein
LLVTIHQNSAILTIREVCQHCWKFKVLGGRNNELCLLSFICYHIFMLKTSSYQKIYSICFVKKLKQGVQLNSIIS